MKGVVLERVSRRHAGRHRPRHSRARRAGRRARAGRVLSLLSRRHHLPGRRRSRRGLGAPRHCRRDRRLPVRRARQRRAVGGVSRVAAEEGRRAHRAQVRAAHRQPHVRRPRSVCAGGGLAGEGHRAGLARPEHHRLSRPSICRGRWWRPTRIDRRGGARRSVRQPDHQYRSPRRSSSSAGGGAIAVSVGGRDIAAHRRDLCRGPGRRVVRTLRQHRSPRGRGQRRRCGRRASGWPAAPGCRSGSCNNRCLTQSAICTSD